MPYRAKIGNMRFWEFCPKTNTIKLKWFFHLFFLPIYYTCKHLQKCLIVNILIHNNVCKFSGKQSGTLPIFASYWPLHFSINSCETVLKKDRCVGVRSMPWSVIISIFSLKLLCIPTDWRQHELGENKVLFIIHI